MNVEQAINAKLNPVRDYAEVRDAIHDGDLFFCWGRGSLLSWIIAQATDNGPSHCGMLFWWDGRLMLLHSDRKGVQFYPFSQYLGAYRGALLIARRSGMSPLQARAMREAAMPLVNKRYDRIELAVRIPWRMAIGVTRTPRANSAYICSELVAECLRRAGVGVDHDRRGIVTPRTILESPYVWPVARVK